MGQLTSLAPINLPQRLTKNPLCKLNSLTIFSVLALDFLRHHLAYSDQIKHLGRRLRLGGGIFSLAHNGCLGSVDLITPTDDKRFL